MVIVSPLDFLFFGMKTLTFELGRFLIHITNGTVMCVASPPRGLGTGMAPVLQFGHSGCFLKYLRASAGGCCKFWQQYGNIDASHNMLASNDDIYSGHAP